MNRFPLLLLSLLAPLGLAAAAFAQEEPAYPTRFRVTGLFSPDREADFRAALAELPELKLEALEYERAEAVLA